MDSYWLRLCVFPVSVSELHSWLIREECYRSASDAALGWIVIFYLLGVEGPLAWVGLTESNIMADQLARLRSDFDNDKLSRKAEFAIEELYNAIISCSLMFDQRMKLLKLLTSVSNPRNPIDVATGAEDLSLTINGALGLLAEPYRDRVTYPNMFALSKHLKLVRVRDSVSSTDSEVRTDSSISAASAAPA